MIIHQRFVEIARIELVGISPNLNQRRVFDATYSTMMPGHGQ